GWFDESLGQDREAWAAAEYEESLQTEALLLGRRSDEWFASRWNSRSGDWADRLNALPKYVVSSNLDDPRWRNSTVLRDDVVGEVSRLREELDGDIVVYASRRLARTLIDNDLVDEVRLIVFPIVVGEGDRLFDEVGDKKPMRLVDTRTVGDGLVYVAYEF